MQTVLRLEPSNASIALEVAKNMLGRYLVVALMISVRFLLGRFKGALGVYQQLEPVVQDLHARWVGEEYLNDRLILISVSISIKADAYGS